MGAEVGDHFLYGLGQLLQAKVRASDLVARLEEDHFATVLLPDCDSHYAEIVAEKVRSAIAGYRLHWGLHRARVKASISVVQVQPTLDTPEGVISAATMACAEAKGRRRRQRPGLCVERRVRSTGRLKARQPGAQAQTAPELALFPALSPAFTRSRWCYEGSGRQLGP